MNVPEPISFVVKGTPVPQPRPRISMRGGFARAYTPADHPVVAYREAILAQARLAAPKRVWKERFGGRKIHLAVWCCFARPKSHYGAKGKLKSDAPILPRPDVDNLMKAVMDAFMLGQILEDDTFVARGDPRKRYVSDRVGSHVFVQVSCCTPRRRVRRMSQV